MRISDWSSDVCSSDLTATVNYATEKAKVDFTGSVAPEDLISTVEATGYTATLPAPQGVVRGGRHYRRGDQSDPGRDFATADPATRLARIDCACGRIVDDPAIAVHELAVAGLDARIPRRRLGRTPLPPRCSDECPTRRGNNGHSDLGGGVGGLPVVTVGVVLRSCRNGLHEDGVQPVPTAGGRSGTHISGSRFCGPRIHTGRSEERRL